MEHQPVPAVTHADVARVVARDFAADERVATTMLAEYGIERYHNEPARVRLAVLKLADGDLKQLRAHLDVALADFRDVLAAAEYPEYGRTINPPAQPGPTMERDWSQYERWLRR
jgi:predicted Fe-Mo cluster-binding NifX family protein